MKVKIILSVFLCFFLLNTFSFAQNIRRGDPTFRKVGVHRGNQVRTVFTNFGMIAQPEDQGPRGAWKYDANAYVGDVSPLVGVRLPIKNYYGDEVADTLHSVIITPVSRPGGGDYAPGGGTFWGFEPIPGFANDTLNEIGKGVAMSHQPESWPTFWPDHPDWLDEDGYAEWNGYFGRGQLNADQESYFWMDDNQDEKMYNRYNFLPDSADETRKGAALRMMVRGLQWNNFLAQDVIFWLYEINNIGTTIYDQAAFGTIVGTYVGGAGDEWNDDVSFFDIREAITYSWDFDGYISPSSNPDWQPSPSQVGYIAYAFLESPGNQYDGIDNDGDLRNYPNTAPYFSEASFLNHTVQEGDELVLIEPGTYKRSIYVMPADSAVVYSLGKEYKLYAGITNLAEGNLIMTNRGPKLNDNALDGFDNDLDGLIDENYQVHFKQYKEDATTGEVLIDTLNPLQYIDFVNAIGTDDDMIDESRSDGIDNDNDWFAEYDDVGEDGKEGTMDAGENDGMPTFGEPNFDKTDVEESDQIGLTSFQYFVPSGDIVMSDEEDMWRRMRPGHFDVPRSIQNNVAIRGEDGDFVYGSGYFPLLPGETERFSLALAFGDDRNGIFKTKRIAQMIYNSNYNFPKPPEKPTVHAVAGDGKVTLYWDSIAETSIDFTTKEQDFEGYKIYKGTDPDFTDAFVITDGLGYTRWHQPEAQFDLKNGIKGYFLPGETLYSLMEGMPYYLGEDSGIKNTFTDTDVINGKTYYYAVVAYDRGQTSSDIFPSENTKSIYLDAAGVLQLDQNTAAATPSAPVSGYVPPESGIMLDRVSGGSSYIPYFSVVDPVRIEDATYEVTFTDSISQGVGLAESFTVANSETGEIVTTGKALTEDKGEVFNGVTLSFNTDFQSVDSIRLNRDKSGFNNTYEHQLRYTIAVFDFQGFPLGDRVARDYEFIFTDTYDKPTVGNVLGVNRPSINTNFEIYDVTESEVKKVPFLFMSGDDSLNNLDRVIMLNQDTSNFSWYLDFFADSTGFNQALSTGDTLSIVMNKPVSSADIFSFSTSKAEFNAESAKDQLDKIKAVPNPYVVTNKFEKPLPYQIRGRGERVIHFINLPPSCKISIYNSAGTFINEIQHDGALENGAVTWDLKTREGLDVSYGVYFYIVEAEDLGIKKTGKLAIIK